MKIGVSLCFLGEVCTYDAQHHFLKELELLKNKHTLIGVCPEVLGGLPTPRAPSEICSFSPLKVMNIQHQDVTQEYILGAKRALDIFLKNDVKAALLKAKSPSCGSMGVYDGTFSHTLIDGQGVFVNMCQEHGIHVFHEGQIDELLKYIGKEDDYGTYFKDSTGI